MYKREIENQWKKLFDKNNIKYEYKKLNVDVGQGYFASPSFYLPSINIYLHVGNRHRDMEKITKDQFIYEKAVKKNIITDVFITHNLPEDVVGDRAGVLYSLKEKQEYRILLDNNQIQLEKVTTEKPNKFKGKVNIIDDDGVEILEDVEKLLSLSSLEYECLPIYMSYTLKFLQPYKMFSKDIGGEMFAGIQGDQVCILLCKTTEKDDFLYQQGVEQRYILIQGNHKGEFCYSLYTYLVRDNRFNS